MGIQINLRRKTPPLLSEIERLKSELAKAHETIKNVSFNENPDIFCVRKDDNKYFGGVTVLEALQLLRTIESPKNKINIAWELVESGKN